MKKQLSNEEAWELIKDDITRPFFIHSGNANIPPQELVDSFLRSLIQEKINKPKIYILSNGEKLVSGYVPNTDELNKNILEQCKCYHPKNGWFIAAFCKECRRIIDLRRNKDDIWKWSGRCRTCSNHSKSNKEIPPKPTRQPINVDGKIVVLNMEGKLINYEVKGKTFTTPDSKEAIKMMTEYVIDLHNKDSVRSESQ